jgi:hypothetical protein
MRKQKRCITVTIPYSSLAIRPFHHHELGKGIPEKKNADLQPNAREGFSQDKSGCKKDVPILGIEPRIFS